MEKADWRTQEFIIKFVPLYVIDVFQTHINPTKLSQAIKT